jgi:tripartite-type tricarboxylate transporter receptor subunit TctC
MKRSSQFLSVVLIAALFLFQGSGISAAEFPTKPITLVVGFGAGGMTDVCSRLFAEKIGEFLGQKVIVENKPGAGGFTALKSVLEGSADGYTFVSFSSSTAAGTRLLGRPMGIEQIGLLGSTMTQERVLFAAKDAPFGTFEEFLAYAKEKPVTFGSGGSIWADQVVEAMGKQLGLQLRMLPFKSGAEASAAILGGHVMLAETGVGTGAWQSALKGGLKVLAVLTDGDLRDYGFPDVKSIRDYDVKYYVRMYYGYAVPSAVPEQRRQKLESAIQFAVEHPEIAVKMKELDLYPKFLPSTVQRPIIEAVFKEAAELTAFIKK